MFVTYDVVGHRRVDDKAMHGWLVGQQLCRAFLCVYAGYANADFDSGLDCAGIVLGYAFDYASLQSPEKGCLRVMAEGDGTRTKQAWCVMMSLLAPNAAKKSKRPNVCTASGHR